MIEVLLSSEVGDLMGGIVLLLETHTLFIGSGVEIIYGCKRNNLHQDRFKPVTNSFESGTRDMRRPTIY